MKEIEIFQKGRKTWKDFENESILLPLTYLTSLHVFIILLHLYTCKILPQTQSSVPHFLGDKNKLVIKNRALSLSEGSIFSAHVSHCQMSMPSTRAGGLWTPWFSHSDHSNSSALPLPALLTLMYKILLILQRSAPCH
jgi:hypothetical protein